MLGNLKDFMDALKSIPQDSEHEILDFLRKHIIHGTPFIFKDNEDEFYEFRKKISNKWGILFHEVFITGSAKLGYSFFKEKIFDENSDVDVAIVSSKLFDSIMKCVEDFQWKLRNKIISLSERDLNKYHEFLEYVAIGWIRPDKLPYNLYKDDNRLQKEWFNYFNSISNGKSEVGNYKVTAGVYKSYYHFEKYTFSSIKQKCNRFK
ncbi:hypothetical protein [Rodentibacter pneumotropicus]|uniref:hypothetical protein n=2 Tax=Rodentibacter pneumotropicus TaxID=758 RepID=UPI00109C42BF|nr:hypothetical protein [Rodentibacter pneumotropicus]THA02365.1 hypothetical protein D3M72_05975 [Rodentibacter pneumotropicus]